MGSETHTDDGGRAYDAIVVGAGFAGLYALHRLRTHGLSVLVLEQGPSVGGTWYWNAYPGCRCDAESLDYSYSFSEELQQDWVWSERYASQPEILRYLNHVADRFDLRRNISLETRVTAAHYDEATCTWDVETDTGERLRSTYCVFATGNLSVPLDPPFQGLDSFRGDWYQTSRFPQQGVDFSGRRVAVVGTGSTGIQLVARIAPDVDHLYVFQRTANYSVPARNAPLSEDEQAERKRDYSEYRKLQRVSGFGSPTGVSDKTANDYSPEERQEEMELRWALGGGARVLTAFTDVLSSNEANTYLADFVREKIRATVKNQTVAKLLCPNDHPIATKRICVDTNYFETFNRENVTLVDVRTTPIDSITPTGIRLANGTDVDVDVIVFAIGFDAFSGPMLNIDIRGRGGVSLREEWRQGPRAYLGVAIHGFPNLFTITGPASPSVLSVMTVSIEQHVDWIGDCIENMQRAGITAIEASLEAQDAWMTHSAELANETLFPKAKTWYTGSNVPGKPEGFIPYVGGLAAFREKCDHVAANGYEGFQRSSTASGRAA